MLTRSGDGIRSVPVDLDLVDDVVGALDGGEPVDRGGDRGPGAGLGADPLGDRLGMREPFGVDVVQRQLELAVQLGEAAQVGDDVAGELDAAGADERSLAMRETIAAWPETSNDAQSD